MKEFGAASWNERKERLMPKFIAGLGEARVRASDDSFLLLFDLNDNTQMAEFNRFGHAALTMGLAHVFIPLSDHMVEMRIAGGQEPPQKLIQIAEIMSVPSVRKENNEVTRRIVRGEPEHVIASVTQTPWNVVEGTPYAARVLEPVQAIEITDELRRKQELAVGYVLNDESKASAELEVWLEHQREVERKHGTKPRTLLPENWASKEGLSRAAQFKDLHPTKPLAGFFKQ